MGVKDIFNLFKEAFNAWREDRAARLAASLAYYTLFSLAPLLILVIALAGFVLGQEAAEGQIVAQTQHIIGAQAAAAVEAIIEGAGRPAEGIIATIIGIALLLVGASNIFSQLQDALNTIWRVPPLPSRGFVAGIKDRLAAIGMILVIGFLLLASFLIDAAFGLLDNLLGGFLPPYVPVLRLLKLVVSFAVVTLLFAIVYRTLPNARIAWRDVWIGAAMTSALFALGNWLISLYLGSQNMESTYGVAASFIILLLWVYYAAQIFLFGAELTEVYANKYGSRVTRSGAVITPEAPVLTANENR